MKTCANCGGSAPDAAVKCPGCRSFLIAPPKPAEPAHASQWAGGHAAPPPPAYGSVPPPYSSSPPPPYSSSPPPAYGSAPPPAYGQYAYAPTGPAPARSSGGANKKLIGVLVAVLAGFAAWGAYGAVTSYLDDPYSGVNEMAFVQGCTDAGGDERSCQCTIDWIEANIPKDTARAFWETADDPGFSAASAPPWFRQAVETCHVAR